MMSIQRLTHMVQIVSALLLLLSPTLTTMTSGLEAKHPLQFQKSVVKLVDSNFEHQTQASTGMTTGSWLLWFYNAGDKTEIDTLYKEPPMTYPGHPDHEKEPDPDAAPKPEILDNGWWDEHNLVLASVHVGLARETVKRFNIDVDNDVPCFVFLHKHKLYRYNGPLQWEMIQQFVTGGYTSLDGEKIPAPRGHLHKMMDLMRETALGHIVLASIVIVIFCFIFYTIAVAQLLSDESKAKMRSGKKD